MSRAVTHLAFKDREASSSTSATAGEEAFSWAKL
jgi:hypothetical protein